MADDPRANGLDHQKVGDPGDHRVAAGAKIARFGGHQPQGALQPFRLGRAVDVEPDDPWQPADDVAGRRVIDAHQAAQHRGGRSPAAVAQDLVARAHQLAVGVEEIGEGPTRRAAQPVADAVRHEREHARRELERRLALHLEPAAALGDDVEHHAAIKRRQCQPPRGGELAPAVENTVHPQVVQDVGYRIHRRPRIREHAAGRRRGHYCFGRQAAVPSSAASHCPAGDPVPGPGRPDGRRSANLRQIVRQHPPPPRPVVVHVVTPELEQMRNLA